jgi:ABC-type sugar transport system substrate-binding protein
MRKALALSLFVAALLSVTTARAQSPNYNVGPVWRVTYVHIKAGQGDEFWKDVRTNLRPVWDEEKKQGLIADYKVFTNATSNAPNDWSVAIAILYADWAALDQMDAKAATIVVQHYGSREAMNEAGRKRADIGEVVASHLAREVNLK